MVHRLHGQPKSLYERDSAAVEDGVFLAFYTKVLYEAVPYNKTSVHAVLYKKQ